MNPLDNVLENLISTLKSCNEESWSSYFTKAKYEMQNNTQNGIALCKQAVVGKGSFNGIQSCNTAKWNSPEEYEILKAKLDDLAKDLYWSLR